ncbi:MAG TPA: class I SAM-dependent methyltransferase [Fimbriimonadaceae bacterium]|nr:class I SAM-dependent methyltransferase [Fimbriimonadaceae bacterium]
MASVARRSWTTERLVRRFYPEVDFGGYAAVNGTAVFYLRVNALVKPDSVVLDIGCGRGAWLEDPCAITEMRKFKGRCAEVIGIDVDEAAAANPSLDRYEMIENGRWPVADASVDVAFADYVVEHIEDVDAFFAEARRVLKPGGHLCLRTPNRHFYVAWLSRMIPNRLHGRLVSRVQQGRHEEDVFPTVYRCNTRRSLLRTFGKHGLSGVVMLHEAEPLYLTFHPAAFWLGVMHQRHAPAGLRANLFAFARKGDSGS